MNFLTYRDFRVANLTHRSRIGQNAILDRGLATILATVAIIGALASYFLFSGTGKIQQQIDQIAAVIGQTESLYAGQPDYQYVNSNDIAKTGTFPAAWVVDQGGTKSIVSFYKTFLAFGPSPRGANAFGAYFVILDGIPYDACVQIATTIFTPKTYIVAINHNVATFNKSPTIAQATADCTPGPSNEVELHLY